MSSDRELAPQQEVTTAAVVAPTAGQPAVSLAGSMTPAMVRSLQRTAGNQKVAAYLGARRGEVHPSPLPPAARRLQRALVAYERPHSEILPSAPSSMGPPAGVSAREYTPDAPRLRTTLTPLISAGQIEVRPEGDRVFFFPQGLDQARALALLTAAGYRNAQALVDALADPHGAWLYAHEAVTRFHGLFTFETGRRTDVMQVSDRPLSGAEIAEARRVFGPGLNYGAIRVVEDPVLGAGEMARTLPSTIYFPPGASKSPGFMPWLIHELMHSWQYQHGVGVARTATTAFACWVNLQTYAYGGDAGLRTATAAGGGLRSFNTEQQGDIASDYYRRLLAGGNVAAFAPYVSEIQTPP